MQPGQRLRSRAGCLVPRGQGKIEFGLDLVGGPTSTAPTAISACATSGSVPAGRRLQGAGRGRAAQFGLGQLPQVGFRASAVHAFSVLP